MTGAIESLADTVIATAARLSVSRAELYKQISAGAIRVRKMGRRTLIERSEQERWLAALPYKDAQA